MEELKLGDTAKEASHLVSGPKQDEHGSSLTNFTVACNLFKILTDIELKPEQGALFLACLKLGRMKTRRKKDDILDCLGYLDMFEFLNSVAKETKHSE